MRYLGDNDVPLDVCAAVLRYQMLLVIWLKIHADLVVVISGSTKGTMTGTRVAGCFVHAPVNDMLREMHSEWELSAF